MKLLFLDFESQGPDAATTNPTEVGALTVQVDYMDGKPYFITEGEYSSLIYSATYPPQTEEIIEITGITDEMLKKDGKPGEEVFRHLQGLIHASDWVLAHNKAFDETLYGAASPRFGVPAVCPQKGWICTLIDVPWAKKYRCKQLAHLAYDHGLLVHPATLHRALDDVKLLSMLISNYDIREIIKYRETPWVYIRAVIPPPWEDQGRGVEQAKKLGFRWQEAGEKKFEKLWVLRLKETEISALKERAPFPLKRLLCNE